MRSSLIKKNAGRQRAPRAGCGAAPPAVDGLSEPHRPRAPDLHRRNLDHDQHGAASGWATCGQRLFCATSSAARRLRASPSRPDRCQALDAKGRQTYRRCRLQRRRRNPAPHIARRMLKPTAGRAFKRYARSFPGADSAAMSKKGLSKASPGPRTRCGRTSTLGPPARDPCQTAQRATENNATGLVDRPMHANAKAKRRMPSIQKLTKVSPVGVPKPCCTITGVACRTWRRDTRQGISEPAVG